MRNAKGEKITAPLIIHNILTDNKYQFSLTNQQFLKAFTIQLEELQATKVTLCDKDKNTIIGEYYRQYVSHYHN